MRVPGAFLSMFAPRPRPEFADLRQTVSGAIYGPARECDENGEGLSGRLGVVILIASRMRVLLFRKTWVGGWVGGWEGGRGALLFYDREPGFDNTPGFGSDM